MGNCGSAPQTKGEDVAAEVPAPELPKEESAKAIDTEEVKAITTENNDAEKNSDDVKPVDDNKQESLEALLTKTEGKESETTEEEKKPEVASETKEDKVEPKPEKEEGTTNTEAEKASKAAITQ